MLWFRKKEWIKYSDEDGFEASFPKNPQVNKHEGLIPNTYTKIIEFKTWGNLEVYMISVTKINEYFGTPYNFLYSALEMYENGINNCKVSNKEPMEIDSLPAIKIDINIGKERLGKGQFIFKNNKLFCLSVILTKASSSKEEKINRFLNNFKLINNPPRSCSSASVQ